MFKPGFQLPSYVAGEIFDAVMQAPPSVAVIVDPTNMGGADAYAAAVDIVTKQAGSLGHFISGQRQILQIGGVEQWAKTLTLDGLQARYTNSQGTERLEIRVRPGRTKTLIESPLFIDVVSDFRAWPYPGSQTLGDPAPFWGAFVESSSNNTDFDLCSVYDPAYYPTDDHDGQPLLRDPSADSNQLPHGWRGDDAYNPGIQGGYVPDMWLTDIGAGKAYDKKLKGKQYWEVELVRLPDAVPDSYSVLDPTAIDDGSRNQGATYDSRPQSYTRLFPAALNTFLNPVIGLAPGYFLDNEEPPAPGATPAPGNPPNSNTDQPYFIHKIGGLDTDTAKPRSIAMIRNSTMDGSIVQTSWVPSSYNIDTPGWELLTVTDIPSGVTYLKMSGAAYGSRAVSVSPNPITDVPGAVPPVPMPTRTWNPFDLVVNGDYLYIMDGVQTVDFHGGVGAPTVTITSSVVGPITGPPTGSGVDHVYGVDRTLEKFSWSGADWYRVAKAGDPPYVASQYQGYRVFEAPLTPGSPNLRLGVISELYEVGDGLTPAGPGPNSFANGEIPINTEGPIGSFNTGPVTRVVGHNFVATYPAIFGDFVAYDEITGDPYVAIPLGAAVGRTAPVLKGRADHFKRGDHRSHPLLGATDTMPPGTDPLLCYDTRVNLGDIKVGGRVMFYTDTDSRKVWVGYDGVWHGAVGTIVTLADIAAGNGYACLMDIQDGTDPDTGLPYEPDYRAAAWYRYGPTWLRIHVSGGMLYSPPPGAKLLGDA